MKTFLLSVAAVCSVVSVGAIAQVVEKPPKVPTGYEVKGYACIVEIPNGQYVKTQCATDMMPVEVLDDRINNRPLRYPLHGGGNDGGGDSGASR